MLFIKSKKKCLWKLFCLCNIFLVVVISSCEKTEVLSEPVQKRRTGDGEIIVGEKVESPFLLRNMQRSIDSLSTRSGLRSKIILEPTHLYVRFLPLDTTEYERLVADKTLDLDPYPLDRKLTEGDSYHDPSLPQGAITWQYTVVPVEYNLKDLGITYEILEELYILDENIDREDISVSDSQLRSTNSTKFTWKMLVQEALIQTGIGKATLRSKWTPAATIKAYDDLMEKYIPIQGVKVRIRYFSFLKAYHYTDVNGNVTFDDKRTSVEYSIEWERDMWDIRDDGTQAYYHGPNQKGRWNLNIGTGTQKSLHYSAIHRALYKYYYGDCCGLVRPSKSLKISYQTGRDPDGDLGSTKPSIVRTWNWIFSAIKIYEKSLIKENGKVKERISPVSVVFSTTLHELAHASHACRMTKSGYDNTSRFVKDSWAVAVEWYLDLDEYQKLRLNDYDMFLLENKKDMQNWPNTNRSHCYSSLFIDMVDSYNQGNDNSERPYDVISGYSMGLIDSKLVTLKNYTDVEIFMKGNAPANVTINQINKFLKLYKEKWID